MMRAEVIRDKLNRPRQYPSILMVGISCLFFLCVSVFLKSSYEGLREEFIQGLARENRVICENQRLKTELSAMTHSQYLEFKAMEKLGLKKPKEEEVVVVR